MTDTLRRVLADARKGSKTLVVLPTYDDLDTAMDVVEMHCFKERRPISLRVGRKLNLDGGGSITFRTATDARGSEGFGSSHVYLGEGVERVFDA